MIRIRVQLEELVGDMYSHVREVDITLAQFSSRPTKALWLNVVSAGSRPAAKANR